jgi:hypothetical protein
MLKYRIGTQYEVHNTVSPPLSVFLPSTNFWYVCRILSSIESPLIYLGVTFVCFAIFDTSGLSMVLLIPRPLISILRNYFLRIQDIKLSFVKTSTSWAFIYESTQTGFSSPICTISAAFVLATSSHILSSVHLRQSWQCYILCIFTMALPTHSGPRSLIQFLNNFSQSVWLLGRVINRSQGCCLNTGQHKHRINAYTYQTFMPWLGFEPKIPASEREKTVHALDRATTVTGYILCIDSPIPLQNLHNYTFDLPSVDTGSSSGSQRHRDMKPLVFYWVSDQRSLPEFRLPMRSLRKQPCIKSWYLNGP